MDRHHERGQSLVLVVLSLTLLLGFTALAVDTGRFVSERRFLQNTADAAALAGATALTQGLSTAQAEAVARQTITLNYAHEPTGSAPLAPSVVPVYETGHVGDAGYLVDGIFIGSGQVRVALRNPVDYTFGRVLGLVDHSISARARAGFSGGLLPIAVRQFIKAPGPTVDAMSPCSHDENRFMAIFATADTACLGSDTDVWTRVEPTAGSAFDTNTPDGDRAHHGPIIPILGQGSAPDNASDFRGFIALDIRDFSTTTSQDFYNGVTAQTSPNSIKDVETGWILDGGYPGPLFPPITDPPDPLDQVGILSGNSAGLSVDAMSGRFVPGSEVLIAVYPGLVMAIPEFALSSPGQITLPNTGTVSSAGSFKVSRNQAFLGTVDMSTLPDMLDPRDPMTLGTLAGTDPIAYDPDPVTPSLGSGKTVTMRNIQTAGAATGIYTLWVRGQSGSPYLTAKVQPLAVEIGTVTREFDLGADATGKVAQSAGEAVTFTLLLTNHPNRNTSFGGTVALSLDAPLPSGTASVSFSATTVTPTRNGTAVTLSIGTGSLPQGQHAFIVRATGMNGDSPSVPVTHLLPLIVNVAPSSTPGSDEYIDITGWAVMRVVDIDSNSVTAYAITPVIADLTDPRLVCGQQARFFPW